MCFPLGDLYDVLKPGRAPEKRRPRDLRRRQLPMLESAGIITVDEDLVVRLAENWGEALENARELGGELDAEKLARERFSRQRKAYRTREKILPEHHYVNAGADGYVEELRSPVEAEPEEAPSEPELSDLALAIRDYLLLSPGDACQPPGWLGVTLWAYDLVPDRPTLAEVGAALEELGGEAYRRELLERARAA